MKIDISNAELCDKYSILEIKLENGLNVNKELDLLKPSFNMLLQQHPIVNYFYQILLCINKQLWLIEDEKRTHELKNNFDSNFILKSRSIYLINDERAKIKSLIDKITSSYITELKSYEYLYKQ